MHRNDPICLGGPELEPAREKSQGAPSGTRQQQIGADIAQMAARRNGARHRRSSVELIGEAPSAQFSANRTFVQWTGFTASLTVSFYDFYPAAAMLYRAAQLTLHRAR